MGLIRSVHRPSNTSLLRRFQQCQVNKPSSDRLHPVLIEASSLVNGGRSYAASSSSDAIEARKPRRKVSKTERKLMVENFVKKYRETNAGKFPSVKGAMKDVGGSYYTVRQILQEVVYNSKQPSLDTKETSLQKSATKRNEIFTNIGDASQDGELGEVIRPISKEDIGNSSSKIFESKQGQKSSVSVVTDESKDVGTQSDHLIGKPESSQLPDPENNVKQENVENKLKFDGLDPKAGPQESTEISRRELPKVPTGDAEPPKNPSMWNNLKSLANGILSLWKRS